MNEDDFTKRVLELVETNPGPYDSASEDFLRSLKNEVTARNNGEWNDDTAAETMRQFEWVMEQAKKDNPYKY